MGLIKINFLGNSHSIVCNDEDKDRVVRLCKNLEDRARKIPKGRNMSDFLILLITAIGMEDDLSGVKNEDSGVSEKLLSLHKKIKTLEENINKD